MAVGLGSLHKALGLGSLHKALEGNNCDLLRLTLCSPSGMRLSNQLHAGRSIMAVSQHRSFTSRPTEHAQV